MEITIDHFRKGLLHEMPVPLTIINNIPKVLNDGYSMTYGTHGGSDSMSETNALEVWYHWDKDGYSMKSRVLNTKFGNDVEFGIVEVFSSCRKGGRRSLPITEKRKHFRKVASLLFDVDVAIWPDGQQILLEVKSPGREVEYWKYSPWYPMTYNDKTKRIIPGYSENPTAKFVPTKEQLEKRDKYKGIDTSINIW